MNGRLTFAVLIVPFVSEALESLCHLLCRRFGEDFVEDLARIEMRRTLLLYVWFLCEKQEVNRIPE